MKSKVTQQGVLIPREWLNGIDEVDIRRENGMILVVPIHPGDPIRDLGRTPVAVEESDASVEHDEYLYGDE